MEVLQLLPKENFLVNILIIFIIIFLVIVLSIIFYEFFKNFKPIATEEFVNTRMDEKLLNYVSNEKLIKHQEACKDRLCGLYVEKDALKELKEELKEVREDSKEQNKTLNQIKIEISNLGIVLKQITEIMKKELQ